MSRREKLVISQKPPSGPERENNNLPGVGRRRSGFSRGRHKFGECALCGRTCNLTFHHLIPRKLHRRVAFRKNFSREELNRGIDVCRLCHDAIHDFYDEMTLARSFPGLEALRRDPRLARHFEWAARHKT